MRIFPVLLIFSVVGCSTQTSYAPKKKEYGYSDESIGEELKVATFKGNGQTDKDTAEVYAKYRAIEVCKEQGKPYTHLLQVNDKSYTKDDSAPANSAYYYGSSPYYGRVGYSTVGMMYGSGQTMSSKNYTFPQYEVYYECVDRPIDARVALKDISFSQMQSLVKDLKGGVQVDDVLADSPNKGKIQKADIIIKAGGERVGSVTEIFQVARKSSDPNLKIEFFRDGQRKETYVNFLDVTELVAEAQDEIIKDACKHKTVEKIESNCKKKG
jgi:C-terminal processing protease CtpA/Prc